jgi:hypothetical protein
MADLTYKFIGVNTAQLANEVRLLRQNSSTFRALEASAVAAGYTTIEVRMGASLLKAKLQIQGRSIHQDPTQLAPPPLDDQLRGFYRDDPMQPWFVQRQR